MMIEWSKYVGAFLESFNVNNLSVCIGWCADQVILIGYDFVSKNFNLFYDSYDMHKFQIWIRTAISHRLLSAKARFQPRSVHVIRVVLYKVTLGQVSLRLLRFSLVCIIPPVLHGHFHRHVALARRTKGRNLGTLQKSALFRKLGGGLG